MRVILALLVLLLLPSIGRTQLLNPTDERNKTFQLASEAPLELTGAATLTFVEFQKIFDGGSYGALFRRGDGRELVICFVHAGCCSQQAIKDAKQPFVVQLDRERLDDPKYEVELGSPSEKQLVELLNADLGKKRHNSKQTKTLIRLRDAIQNRTPLAEFRGQLAKIRKRTAETLHAE